MFISLSFNEPVKDIMIPVETVYEFYLFLFYRKEGYSSISEAVGADFKLSDGS